MPRSELRASALMCVALCAGSWPVLGAETREEQDLNAVTQQIEASQSRQHDIAEEMAAIAREAEAISARVVAIGQNIQARERSIMAGEERLKSLATEKIRISADLAGKEDELSELLAGLQRLERNPPPALVVAPGDVLAALRGAIMLGAVVPELENEAADLVAELNRLENVRQSTLAEKQGISQNIARLEASRKELAQWQQRKSELLAGAGKQLEDEKARASELAGKAKTLQQLVASLTAERAQAEQARSAQEAETAAARRRQEAALLKPRTAFAENRGRLDYPAQGQIVRRFGDDDGFGGKTKGLFVETRSGAQVIAPADGHIEFAGPFRSYGQLLILDAGDGYHVLLAGMNEVKAGTGEFVRAGEPVGMMGGSAAPGTLMGDRLQDGHPVLYIEFRKNGEAVDSSQWWIGGLAEARG